MARTVIPSRPGLKGPGGAPGQEGDKLPDKLIKYVPAEVLAFFVPTAAALGSGRNGLLLVVLIVAGIGTPGYLWLASRSLPQEKRPLWYFYLLALIAFPCWSVAMAPNVAALFGLDDIAAGVILALAVFLVPLADEVLGKVLQPAK